jgi:HKD family nuclease
MDLILHQSGGNSTLSDHYLRAFTKAVELLIVNAYLTEWEWEPELNPACRHFRMIIGKDFGITRKAACKKVLTWLPASQKANFMVATRIGGFHPKAVFWKEASGDAFAVIGSSNLTAAAFESNCEANIYCPISASDYAAARDWIDKIEKQSLPVSTGWLETYQEAQLRGGAGDRKSPAGKPDDETLPQLQLPRPRGMARVINQRREELGHYAKNRNGLMRLFRDCASGKITSEAFTTRSRRIGAPKQAAGYRAEAGSGRARAVISALCRRAS